MPDAGGGVEPAGTGAALTTSPKKQPPPPSKGKTVLASIQLLDGSLLDLYIEVQCKIVFGVNWVFKHLILISWLKFHLDMFVTDSVQYTVCLIILWQEISELNSLTKNLRIRE